MKALNLIQYLLHENSSDCSVVTELGFPRLMIHLASSGHPDVREAALRGLLELVQDRKGESRSVLTEHGEKLKQILQDWIKGIIFMASDIAGGAREEMQLADSLWNACYNEPSPLREKGLLVLPGEDAPPPDVASKFFEPPLRACAADRDPTSKKKDTFAIEGGSEHRW